MVRRSQRASKLAVVAGGGEADSRSHKVAQIKSAATRLFLKDGFDVVTMDMVARKASVSKSTLYAHFADKKGLFTAVVISEALRVNAEIWSPALNFDDIEDVLRTVAGNYFKIFMTERAFAFKRVIFGALPRFPEIGNIVFEDGPMQISKKIEALLIDASARGLLDVDDTRMAATQFMSLMRSDVEVMGMLAIKALTQVEVDYRIDAAIKMFLARYGK